MGGAERAGCIVFHRGALLRTLTFGRGLVWVSRSWTELRLEVPGQRDAFTRPWKKQTAPLLVKYPELHIDISGGAKCFCGLGWG